MSNIVEWRLKPRTIKNSVDYSLMTKEELQKEGREYIQRLINDGEEIEEIIEREDKLIIKLKDHNG